VYTIHRQWSSYVPEPQLPGKIIQVLGWIHSWQICFWGCEKLRWIERLSVSARWYLRRCRDTCAEVGYFRPLIAPYDPRSRAVRPPALEEVFLLGTLRREIVNSVTPRGIPLIPECDDVDTWRMPQTESRNFTNLENFSQNSRISTNVKILPKKCENKTCSVSIMKSMLFHPQLSSAQFCKKQACAITRNCPTCRSAVFHPSLPVSCSHLADCRWKISLRITIKKAK